MTEPKRQIETGSNLSVSDGSRESGVGETATVPVTVTAKSNSNDIGAALRNAFRATVDEQVPDEMLDLLRRLD